MKIVEKHSHLNGLEFMLVRAPSLWKEVVDAISKIMVGPNNGSGAPCSPPELLRVFESVFSSNFWESQNGHVPDSPEVMSIRGYTPSFLKNRVAISAHFTDCFEQRPEIHARHLAMFNRDLIDVGIEIVPTKTLHDEMSSGVPYYEGELYNLIREGRGVPGVPLVLVGIEQ